MKNQKPAQNPNFLQRAQALRKRIKARTGTKFDIPALSRESQQRYGLEEK